MTKLVHGEDEARKAQETAEGLFTAGGSLENMPETVLPDGETGEQTPLLDIMIQANLIPSKGEGRRLIMQGGVSVNDEKVTDAAATIEKRMLMGDGIIIKKGKKVFHRVVVR